MRLALLILTMMTTGPALAGSPIAEVICAPTGEMQARLTREFGETRRGFGTRGPEQVLEVWTDPSGDWTLVMTYASGQSCIVAMGDNWDYLPEEDPA